MKNSMALSLIMAALGRITPSRDEEGTSLVEYALLLAFIVVVAVVAMIAIGNTVSNSINSSTNTLFQH